MDPFWGLQDDTPDHGSGSRFGVVSGPFWGSNYEGTDLMLFLAISAHEGDP